MLLRAVRTALAGSGTWCPTSLCTTKALLGVKTYSMGSSTVITKRGCSALIRSTMAARVVVLPLSVGPTTRKSPMRLRATSSRAMGRPRASKGLGSRSMRRRTSTGSATTSSRSKGSREARELGWAQRSWTR